MVLGAATTAVLVVVYPMGWHAAYVAMLLAAGVAAAAGTSGKVATPRTAESGGSPAVTDSAGTRRGDGERRLLLLVVVPLLLTVFADPLHPRPLIGTAWGSACHHTALGPALDRIRGRRVLAWGLSLLLCTGEVNGIVLLALKWLQVGPPEGTEDLGHYKHGALIGTFERTLVLIFAANNQFNAVGFILTAKSLVRFHDIALKDGGSRGAEYVLVGTLLSTLLAIGVALLLPHLAG